MSWILTNSGKRLDFLAPSPASIDLNDIVTALSREGRFANHSRIHYTVGQHSLILAHHFRGTRFELPALLHDAHEAYCKDIPAPLKKLIPQYSEICDRLDAVIFKKFGIPWPLPAEVHEADIRLLMTERIALMPESEHDWGVNAEPLPIKIPYVFGEAMVAREMKARLSALGVL